MKLKEKINKLVTVDGISIPAIEVTYSTLKEKNVSRPFYGPIKSVANFIIY